MAKIEWKSWEDLNKVQRAVIGWVDTGACPSYIVENIKSDEKYSGEIYSEEEILEAIAYLDDEWHIVNVDGEESPYYKVTEWAHDGIYTRTGKEDYKEALEELKKHRIHHKDMEKWGIDTVNE
jgi:hypothetical protein